MNNRFKFRAWDGEKMLAHDKPVEIRWLCFTHHRAHHKLYENPELLKDE